MAVRKSQPVDWEAILSGVFPGKTVIEYGANRNIFWEGDPADSVFFLGQGTVKNLGHVKTGQRSDYRCPWRR